MDRQRRLAARDRHGKAFDDRIARQCHCVAIAHKCQGIRACAAEADCIGCASFGAARRFADRKHEISAKRRRGACAA